MNLERGSPNGLNKQNDSLLLFLVILTVSVFLLGSRHVRISDAPPSKNTEADVNFLADINQDTDSNPHQWTILDKLFEKDDELAKVPVSIGSREVSYYENRVSFMKDGAESVTKKRLSDKEKVVGLKLLNVKTGDVQIIKVSTKITPNGVNIVSPDGYRIEIAERPNGIKWNWWNTLYRVAAPEDTVVIKNNFPREEMITTTRIVNGKPKKETRKVVRGFLYVPHSNYFEQEEQRNVLVKAGSDYEKNIVAKAFSILRERGVRSKAFPDKLVVDVKALSSRFFERLPLLEQGDLTEFILEPRKTVERALMILGTNRENSWRYTCNWADACGWVQFTPNTYSYIRRSYPTVQLMTDFKEGAGDHVNSMMAAILLHDSNLFSLIRRYGENIVNDPRLEEYLAASYNGSPRWVWDSLDATLGKTADDWTKRLKTETHGFMFKLRYLIENELP